MVSLAATLYLLATLLCLSTTTLAEPHAIYSPSDAPSKQSPQVAPVDFELIRKELIVGAATIVTRLTQKPQNFVDMCAGCSSTCHSPCPKGCCSWFNLTVPTNKFLKELVKLWDELDGAKGDEMADRAMADREL